MWSAALDYGVLLVLYHLHIHLMGLTSYGSPSNVFLISTSVGWKDLVYFHLNNEFLFLLIVTATRCTREDVLSPDMSRGQGPITVMWQVRKQVSKECCYYMVAVLLHVRGHQCVLDCSLTKVVFLLSGNLLPVGKSYCVKQDILKTPICYWIPAYFV